MDQKDTAEPQSQSREPQSGKSQSRDRAQSDPNNPAQAGVGVRRCPRIGHAGWKMGVDGGPGMGVRDKNRARWGHLVPEKRTQEQLHGEFSACGTIRNF